MLFYYQVNAGELKVTTNNLAIIVNNKFNGATTVGSTINIASKIGIKFFATGGIGGVHLNSEQTLDVSSDLYELSKNNICVVCSGAKSILDINKTYEKLESLGIPRIGYKTKYMPGFWYYQTDNLLDYNFTKISELVKYLKVNQILQNNNGSSVLITYSGKKAETDIQLPKDFNLAVTDESIESLRKLCGNENVRLVYHAQPYLH